MISPDFKKLAEEFGDKLEFFKVDVDAQLKVAEKADIKAVSSLLDYAFVPSLK